MIRAIEYKDRDAFRRDEVPGSFWIYQRDEGQLFEFHYFCPSGSGIEGRLLLGKGFKPNGDRPSWNWNGSTTEPTLTPSVNHRDHWHGWLRYGYWVSV